ncbi:hypothetical protein BCD64_23320 [Nostoc sp. MBR 210]|nr:hypothetical protein BCD64_23320 [Nostoc sp. MBR 210]
MVLAISSQKAIALRNCDRFEIHYFWTSKKYHKPMQIKTISYERVLNLGNYENKKMALFAEVLEGEDPEEAISRLADTVERKIRESVNSEYQRQMLKLEADKERLAEQVANLKAELKQLCKLKDEPENQHIPFDAGATTTPPDTSPDSF